MAKISARGDQELARWTSGVGRYVVLTKQGRVLQKFFGSDGYTLRGRFKLTADPDARIRLVEGRIARGMKRVPTLAGH